VESRGLADESRVKTVEFSGNAVENWNLADERLGFAVEVDGFADEIDLKTDDFSVSADGFRASRMNSGGARMNFETSRMDFLTSRKKIVTARLETQGPRMIGGRARKMPLEARCGIAYPRPHMEPFKNAFSYPNARRIAECLKRAHPAFSLPRFSKGLEEALEPLELKARMHLIADRIEGGLPAHPPVLFPILVKTLAEDEADTRGLRGFLVWPLTEIVARRGLGHFSESMAALCEMTKRFTGEFAIRPFLRHDRELVLKQLHAWCAHPDEHVRRLVSEGSRPLLPWGGNLPDLLEPPHPTLGLLEKLHRDPSDYVRLSVSNHLNDFSKHHPSLVIETLARWRDANPDDARLEKLARHACRTLLKAGHPGALELHGYGSAKALALEISEIRKPSVKLGGHLEYRLVIRNTLRRPVKVMFDYAILHRKANGTLSPKVFKGRVRDLAPGELWEITGRHPLKPVTTRVYHGGVHGFEPRLNGRAFPAMDFLLRV
jgi:3-methyladenine DNA glycosylase AlkC